MTHSTAFGGIKIKVSTTLIKENDKYKKKSLKFSAKTHQS